MWAIIETMQLLNMHKYGQIIESLEFFENWLSTEDGSYWNYV